STCHSAGRRLSRHAAVRAASGRDLRGALEERGVIARAHSRKGLAEEQPDGYQDGGAVVDVVHRAGLPARVPRPAPLGVVKWVGRGSALTPPAGTAAPTRRR